MGQSYNIFHKENKNELETSTDTRRMTLSSEWMYSNTITSSRKEVEFI